MKLKVLVHPAEEGGYWAEVPALPGCVSEGDTFEEMLANIREAAEGWLEVDEFDTEIELLRRNHILLAMLDEFKEEKETVPLEQVEKDLR